VKEIVNSLERNKQWVATEGTEKLYNTNSFIAKMFQLRHELGWKQAKRKIPRAYRREILEEMNGLDIHYGYYIDWELFQRVKKKGYKTGDTPKAILWHKQVDNWRDLKKQGRWMGRSMIFALKGYKMEGLKRIFFVILLSCLPIYITLLFFQFPFWLLGFIGFLIFLIIEVKRSIKMFLITKDKKSFLTPFFDFVSMVPVLFGILDKIFNVSMWKKMGRV
jgi:GT2 family glycosyltransferase